MENNDTANLKMKVATLHEEQIKLWNDIHSSADPFAYAKQIIVLKKKYEKAADCLLLAGLKKHRYTEEEIKLTHECFRGIAICNEKFKNICCHYIANKTQEIISSIQLNI